MNDKQLELKTRALLNEIGVGQHLKGYVYIVESVKILYHKRNATITSKVYPKVADTFDATPSSVERCIRHSIELSFSIGNREKLVEIFGYYPQQKGKVTNAQFLLGLIAYMEYQELSKTS